ncbi:MAG TPA: hypothetical protein VME92_05250 [Acetobacteraceae bacterium]|nr:hypothetical protein [Acetobacteraceae bacterium]
MDEVDRLLHGLFALLVSALAILFGFVGAIDEGLRQFLARAGIGGPAQTMILILAALLLVLLGARLFGGLVRLVIVIFLVLFLVHVLRPVWPG